MEGDLSGRREEIGNGKSCEQTTDLVRLFEGSYYVIFDWVQEKEVSEFLAHLTGGKGERDEVVSKKMLIGLKNKHHMGEIEYYQREGGRIEKLILSG